MSQYSRPCSSHKSMRNTEQNHCSLCHLKRKMSCKVFSGASCATAGLEFFFALMDKIESQFDQYILWGSYLRIQ